VNGLTLHDLLIVALDLAAALMPLLAVLFVGSLVALARPVLRKVVRARAAAQRALPAFHRRRRPF
jgi:hypothetical protein